MCNCIEEKEQRLLELLKEKHPDKNIDDSLNGWCGTGFQNQSIMLDQPGSVLYHEFVLEYTFTKKNGKQSGIRKLKTNIIPTYCCFCGEKIKKD